ncbi:MAG: hypothetical protein ABIN18_07060 [Pseudomonadota bacterium]
MKKIIFTTLFLFGFVSISTAFEIDGFISGMSMQEAQKNVKRFSYDKVQVQEGRIMAFDYPEKGSNRLVNLIFCNGKLVHIMKSLTPRFDYFTRLVDQKRKEFGKPVDAWSVPTDVTSNIESNSITFLWTVDDTIIHVSYTEFSSNNDLSISYDTYDWWRKHSR